MLSFGHSLKLTERQRRISSASPPSLAPILVGESVLDEYDVTLDWTPSNKMGPGDVYIVYWSFDGGAENALPDVNWPTTTAMFSDSSNGPGEYCFRVTGVNAFGEGPSSNTVCFNLPGESNASYYRRPDGISRYFRPDGVSFYLRP